MVRLIGRVIIQALNGWDSLMEHRRDELVD
jgi:hypothetical protein